MYAEKYGTGAWHLFADENYFANKMLKAIEENGGFAQINSLLKEQIPFKLMIEVLKPYVFNMRTKKVDNKLDQKKILSV